MFVRTAALSREIWSHLSINSITVQVSNPKEKVKMAQFYSLIRQWIFVLQTQAVEDTKKQNIEELRIFSSHKVILYLIELKDEIYERKVRALFV